MQILPQTCLDYADVTAKFALWSADGRSFAILHQAIRSAKFADLVRVLDIHRCKAADPLVLDEFPNKNFTPEGYQTYPVIPAYDWNGRDLFVFNTFVRNGGYGDLYLYDMNTGQARLLNPIENTCCYRDARFSPDGTHLLVVFQDIRQGAESETRLYLPAAGANRRRGNVPSHQTAAAVLPQRARSHHARPAPGAAVTTWFLLRLENSNQCFSPCWEIRSTRSPNRFC